MLLRITVLLKFKLALLIIAICLLLASMALLTLVLLIFFNPTELKFHVEKLREADPALADPEDIRALEQIVYEPVDLEEIPQDCIDAVVAIEDKTFWTNSGFDLKGLGRLALSSMGFSNSGGSTISQQVIKLSTDRFYNRSILDKYIENIYAIKLNDKLAKEQILEMYLNNAYFGDYNYGIQAAALSYYNKNVSDLNLDECSYVAGILQLPNLYSPTIGNEQAGRNRQLAVLKAMLREGYISSEEINMLQL